MSEEFYTWVEHIEFGVFLDQKLTGQPGRQEEGIRKKGYRQERKKKTKGTAGGVLFRRPP